MSDQLPANDEQLELKKRARRRLIGAVVFATVAAVVLPMVMDAEPPAALPNIELRIPAQDKGFIPPGAGRTAPTGAGAVADVPPPLSEPVAPVSSSAAAPAVAAAPIVAAPPVAAPVADPKPTAKVEPNPKAAATTTPPPPPSSKASAAAQAAEAKRAQAILAGQTAKPAGEGPHVVLIGAFSNPGNVDVLKKKIGEMGIKVYTEPLETPQGRKIRVRAGPFPNREAADRALARIKAIGVNGIVAAKS